MSPSGQAIAIIPARGGSKGIPRKNIRPLFGRPLIAWTIDVALAAPSLSRVIVSTEDEEIARLAVELGAEVPFLRPAELAGDESLPGKVVDHVLRRLAQEGCVPDFVATLYPTHPFRSSALVEHLVRKGLEGHSPVFAARALEAGPCTFVRRAGEILLPVRDKRDTGERPLRWLRAFGSFNGLRPGRRDRPFCHVLEHPAEFIDIDTPEDLALAEAVLARGLYRIQ